MKSSLFTVCILVAALLIATATNCIAADYQAAQEAEKPGIAIFGELGGKGYGSGNIEFPLNFNHRLSFGLTVMDYNFSEQVKNHNDEKEYITPGIMYYYLMGKNKSFFELGGGISVYPRFKKEDYKDDGPLTIHGVAGYRYQKKNGILFRAGFTPFYRINGELWPLFGLSLGYCW